MATMIKKSSSCKFFHDPKCSLLETTLEMTTSQQSEYQMADSGSSIDMTENSDAECAEGT